MLRGQLDRVRRNPRLTLMALAGGLLLGLLVGIVVDAHSGGSVHVAGTTATTVFTAHASRRAHSSPGPAIRSTLSPAPADANRSGSAQAPADANRSGSAQAPPREALQAALNRGVQEAKQLDGEAAAAIWVDGDSQPVLSGPVLVPHRLWSMSKAVATLAALGAVNDRPDPVLSSAVTDAIRRSDNCAIRRVIVGLQDRLGAGTPGAVRAFEQILATAHARLEQAPQAASAEPACVRYLDSHQGGLPGSDLGTAAEFGTAEWTEYDAISFAHALSAGAYGFPGADLLKLMALPKEPPLETPEPPSSPPLDWGAGAAFPAAWRPAWKAGWGGSQNRPPRFLAGQIVVLGLARTRVAVAAIFVPRAEPATDNPGITRAPQALELMFEAARTGLEDEHVGMI
jgi:hypothetical protein